jgi:O-succinylbenzoic acid--CoA ligase
MNRQLFDDLIRQSQPDWLIGYEAQEILDLTDKKITQLNQLQATKVKPLNILLSATNYDDFITSFLASIITNNNIFLCNPNWQKLEWQQVFDLVKPDLIWTENQGEIVNKITHREQEKQKIASSLIMIPTGGSLGKIRFAIHTWSTLTASVEGFCDYFQTETINSCCLLPLYHVSGLMQLMRSFLTQGKLMIFPYQTLKQGNQPRINPQEFFISLVPTQLQFLLQSNPHWLASFQTVLLGGAPAWQSLLERARKYNIALAPTYGMTETASQIVTLKPKDFLAGNNSSGQVLPHAKVTIVDKTKQQLPNGNIGKIKIQSNSLYLGYYPQLNPNQIFTTDDLGWFDEQDYLHLVGRNSQKIITGGENVFPSEVEAAIFATGLVKDVCVIGLPDCHWGQVVTAVYVPITSEITVTLIQQQLQNQLSKYKHPKNWFSVDNLPRNQQGKINYQQIFNLVIATER